MTKPYIVPFKAEHMLAFVDRDTDILQEMRFATQKEQGGPAFTAMLDNKILGCAGIILLWPGVGQAWVSFGKEIEGYGVWMSRMVKAILRDSIRTFQLHRIEAVVLSDNTRNIKWIKAVGFSREDRFAYKYTQDKQDGKSVV